MSRGGEECRCPRVLQAVLGGAEREVRDRWGSGEQAACG